MALILKIEENESFEFFKEYDKLGNLQKDIWRAAVWWCKRFPCACPRQERIAEKIGCRREHVNRAFSKFKKLGWMYLTSRGARRTKIIGIPTHLLMLDLVNRQYFAKIERTSERTHSYSRLPKHTCRKTSDSSDEISIPDWLSRLKISYESKLKLSFFSEAIFQRSLESAKYANKRGVLSEDKIEWYVIGAAIKMGKDRNIEIDWEKYYKILGKKVA